jgi:hypothetical protein
MDSFSSGGEGAFFSFSPKKPETGRSGGTEPEGTELRVS